MSPLLSAQKLGSLPDERLVALAGGEGGEEAFAVLVERYRVSLLRFAQRVGGPERAEDVLQQCFMQTWATLQAGAEVRHVRGWLYQIVRHAASKGRDGHGLNIELAEVLGLVGAQSPHDVVEQRLRLRGVVRQIGELPDQQRTALVHTAFEGRSRGEIALLMGVSEGAVRQLVHRGRARLRNAAAAFLPVPLLQRLASARHAQPLTHRVVGLVNNTATPRAGLALSKPALGVMVSLAAVSGGTGVYRVQAAQHPASARGGGHVQRVDASTSPVTATDRTVGSSAHALARRQQPSLRTLTHTRPTPAGSRADSPGTPRATTNTAPVPTPSDTPAVSGPASAVAQAPAPSPPHARPLDAFATSPQDSSADGPDAAPVEPSDSTTSSAGQPAASDQSPGDASADAPTTDSSSGAPDANVDDRLSSGAN